MKTKKYQKLRSNNLKAAECIYEALKSEKAISLNDFQNLFFNSRVDLPSNAGYQNWRTTEQFLYDHGLMTSHFINGLRIYVATQKTVRTHSFKNATIEYEYVKESDIDKAIEYQTLNDGKIDPVSEGLVIGRNILGLSKKMAKAYAREYKWAYDTHKDWIKEVKNEVKSSPTKLVPFANPKMKYAVLAPLTMFKCIKKVK